MAGDSLFNYNRCPCGIIAISDVNIIFFIIISFLGLLYIGRN